MADKSVWVGTISMGLVTVPVQLKKVVDSRGVNFNQINSETGNRVAYKRVDAVTGEDVEFKKIVKGYESDGKQVVVDPEELSKLKPKSKKSIEIIATVDADKIDPRQLNTPYALTLDNEQGKQTYALLAGALKDTGKVAIGKFVMRDKEHLIAISEKDGQLVAQTLNYSDQMRDIPAEDLPAVPNKLREHATQLVEAYSDNDFDLSKEKDEYTDAVKELLSAKLEGKKLEAAEEEIEQEEPVDLMSALAASVAAAKQRRATE